VVGGGAMGGDEAGFIGFGVEGQDKILSGCDGTVALGCS
jgi:hypothetical protein